MTKDKDSDAIPGSPSRQKMMMGSLSPPITPTMILPYSPTSRMTMLAMDGSIDHRALPEEEPSRGNATSVSSRRGLVANHAKSRNPEKSATPITTTIPDPVANNTTILDYSERSSTQPENESNTTNTLHDSGLTSSTYSKQQQSWRSAKMTQAFFGLTDSFRSKKSNADGKNKKANTTNNKNMDFISAEERARQREERHQKRRFLLIRTGLCGTLLVVIALAIFGGLRVHFNRKNKGNEQADVGAASTTVTAPSTAPKESPPTLDGLFDALTNSPTTVPAPTTDAPTTFDYRAPLIDFLQLNGIIVDADNNQASPSALAVDWMVNEARERGNVTEEYNSKSIQRFATLSILYGLQGTNDVREESEISTSSRQQQQPNDIAISQVDECEWPGIRCSRDERIIQTLEWSRQSFGGTIAREIGLLRDLKILDLANNKIGGAIPEALYQLTKLRELFLYRNKLQGTISTEISNFNSLTRLHLSHNMLSGTFPEDFKSTGDVIRPIKYFNVYSNGLTGTIPSSLRWRQAVFVDFGRNKFNGTVPEDFGETAVSLRMLHLDHNKLEESIPESVIRAGNGRLEALSLNHNRFSGELPGDHILRNKLVQYTIHDNPELTSLGSETCSLSVFRGGEMVEFSADCDICDCDIFCDRC